MKGIIQNPNKHESFEIEHNTLHRQLNLKHMNIIFQHSLYNCRFLTG